MPDNTTIHSNLTNQEALIVRRISRIVSRGERFDAAIESLESVLEEAGARLVALEHWNGGRKPSDLSGQCHTAVIDIEDDRFPHQHIAALREGGKTVGQLALAFRSGRNQEIQKRLAEFLGQQLGMLLIRLRLQERNHSAKKALEAMKRDIAARKFLPRAIALLIRQYRMRRRDAETWLLDQGRGAGLSPAEVAERLVSAHAAAPTLVEPPRRSARVPAHRVA